MNAYELADELDEAVMKLVANDCFFEAQAVEKAANMLCQQADRIAELEAEVNTRTWVRKLLTEPQTNAEPVAWGFFYDDGVIYDCVTNEEYCGESGIPLYTTPQTKPRLSDEEIDETVRKNALGHGRLIYMLNKNVLSNDFKQAIRSLARAIEAKVRGQ